jgi:hypothetical protein
MGMWSKVAKKFTVSLPNFTFWKLNRASEKSVRKLNKVKFQGFLMDFQIALFFGLLRR